MEKTSDGVSRSIRSAGGASGVTPGFFSWRVPTLRAWFGNLGWPILLKQLRTEFRRSRFFVSHFASLGLLGAWMIVVVAVAAQDRNVEASQVGQQLFNQFVALQTVVILLMFPVFSSTAFTEEKANQSLDLLLITTLRPSEIVWGKFLASTIYCLMYVLATVPLLAVSFLFGGVRVEDVLVAYLALIGLTLLVSMFSLCWSSISSSNVRSTLHVYVDLSILGVLAWLWVVEPVREVLESDANQTVVRATLAVLGVGSGGDALVVLILAIDITAIFTFLLLVTTNRIRPTTDDRSSKLRLLTLAYLPVRLFLSLVVGFQGPFDANFTVSAGALEGPVKWTLVFAAVLLLLVTLTFPTEDAKLSRRICDRVRAWHGWRSYARLVAPGPFSGFLYTVFLVTVVCVILFWTYDLSLAPHAHHTFDYLVYETLVTLPIYLGAFASLGFLLSVVNFTPLYSRLTVAFAFVITTLLPMIFWFGQLADRVYYFYFISPIVLWNSLDRGAEELGPAAENEISYTVGPYPIITVAKVVFAAAIAINLAFGVWIARRSGLALWSYDPARSEPSGGRDDGEDLASADDLPDGDAQIV